MKLLPLLVCIVLVGCGEEGDKLHYHAVKVHLAGAMPVELHKAVDAVLEESGAQFVKRMGDTLITAQMFNAAPPTTFGLEIRMTKKSDGVWYEISSEQWSDSLAKKVNQNYADRIADKMGFVIK